jgi:hypothetical protein
MLALSSLIPPSIINLDRASLFNPRRFCIHFLDCSNRFLAFGLFEKCLLGAGWEISGEDLDGFFELLLDVVHQLERA